MNEGAGCARRHGLRSQRRAILQCRRRVLCRGSDILANGPPVTERPHMGAENGGLMKKRLGPSERLYPMPCALVVGGTIDEADVLTAAWLNIVSSTPPSLAMGLRRTRRTFELIRTCGEFTVNLPSTALVAQVDYCGLVSGRTHDKFAEAGLTLEPSAVIATPMIAECLYNLECRVTSEVDVGEYAVIIGEIVEAHAEESILDAAGEKVDVGALDPLAYIAGSREYRALTPKVADAYTIGKSLIRHPDAE